MPLIDLTDDELALLLNALEEAAFFRDARSNVVRSASRRRDRRFGSSQSGAGDVRADHQSKAREYTALAVKLKGHRPELR